MRLFFLVLSFPLYFVFFSPCDALARMGKKLNKADLEKVNFHSEDISGGGVPDEEEKDLSLSVDDAGHKPTTAGADGTLYRPMEDSEILAERQKYIYGNGFGFDGRYNKIRPVLSDDKRLFDESLIMPENIEYIKERQLRSKISETKEYLLYKKILEMRKIKAKRERRFYKNNAQISVMFGGGDTAFVLDSSSSSGIPSPDSKFAGPFVSTNPNLSATLDAMIRITDKYFMELQGYYSFMMPYSAGIYIQSGDTSYNIKDFSGNSGHRAEARVLFGTNIAYFSQNKKSFLSILSGLDFGYYNHLGFFGDILDYSAIGTTDSPLLTTTTNYSRQMLNNISIGVAVGLRGTLMKKDNSISYLDIIFNGGAAVFNSQSSKDAFLGSGTDSSGGSFGLTFRFQHLWRITDAFWIAVSIRDRINFIFSVVDLHQNADPSISSSFNYIVLNQLDFDIGFRVMF